MDGWDEQWDICVYPEFFFHGASVPHSFPDIYIYLGSKTNSGPKTQWKNFSPAFFQKKSCDSDPVTPSHMGLSGTGNSMGLSSSQSHPKPAFSLLSHLMKYVIMRAKIFDEEISFIMQHLTPELHNSQRKENWKRLYNNMLARFSALCQSLF